MVVCWVVQKVGASVVAKAVRLAVSTVVLLVALSVAYLVGRWADVTAARLVEPKAVSKVAQTAD